MFKFVNEKKKLRKPICIKKRKKISHLNIMKIFLYDLLFYIINVGFILNNRSSLHKYKVIDLRAIH